MILNKSERFYHWFVQYESNIIKDTMLKPVREKAGLGSPPSYFSTNPSESVNAILKSKVNYKRSDLPVFVNKMKELVEQQKQELEQAVIDRGKYRLRLAYQSLQISEEKWFRMGINARNSSIKNFHGFLLSNSENSQLCSTLALPEAERVLSVDVDTVSANSSVPVSVYEGIWAKASFLISTDGAIAPAPGYPTEARTVQSASKTGFHTVIPSKSGKFSCDCANYRSLSICAHAVAVAEVNKKLVSFVEWYRKAKKEAQCWQTDNE